MWPGTVCSGVRKVVGRREFVTVHCDTGLSISWRQRRGGGWGCHLALTLASSHHHLLVCRALGKWLPLPQSLSLLNREPTRNLAAHTGKRCRAFQSLHAPAYNNCSVNSHHQQSGHHCTDTCAAWKTQDSGDLPEKPCCLWPGRSEVREPSEIGLGGPIPLSMQPRALLPCLDLGALPGVEAIVGAEAIVEVRAEWVEHRAPVAQAAGGHGASPFAPTPGPTESAKRAVGAEGQHVLPCLVLGLWA